MRNFRLTLLLAFAFAVTTAYSPPARSAPPDVPTVNAPMASKAVVANPATAAPITLQAKGPVTTVKITTNLVHENGSVVYTAPASKCKEGSLLNLNITMGALGQNVYFSKETFSSHIYLSAKANTRYRLCFVLENGKWRPKSIGPVANELPSNASNQPNPRPGWQA